MTAQPYTQPALLASLRAASSSNAAEVCDTCQLQHKIVCTHLTEEQYSSLKATKRPTLASGREKDRMSILRAVRG
ncbi:hypothetical protein F4777DRAFT_598854 [Nemania sp. FL0916]|nr:hypothetical protein F4777DRAFT_598854 [Nemania sp. FL0916]